MSGEPAPVRSLLLALRDAGALLLVLGGLLSVTFVLGQFPTCTRPDATPHVVANVTASEEILGTTLLLPAYFPDRFLWPPVYRAGRAPVAWVAMEVHRRDGAGAVTIGQSVEGDPPAPPLPGKLQRSEQLAFGADQARLRVADTAQGPWCELRWRRGDRRLVLYGHADPATAVTMARSMRSRLVSESK